MLSIFKTLLMRLNQLSPNESCYWYGLADSYFDQAETSNKDPIKFRQSIRYRIEYLFPNSILSGFCLYLSIHLSPIRHYLVAGMLDLVDVSKSSHTKIPKTFQTALKRLITSLCGIKGNRLIINENNMRL